MITDNLAELKAATEAKFGSWFTTGRLRQWGVYNRRKIAGTKVWSQHAWGNAWDIGVANKADGDRVVAWLKQRKAAGDLDIGLVLWWVKSHYDHIHVEAAPKQTGTPPQSKDIEDMKELVKNLQTMLNNAGAKDRNGDALKVDGIWGPMTESAFINGLHLDRVAGAQVTGTFTGTVK